MKPVPRVAAHVRAALKAAVLLAVFQVALESLAMAVRFQDTVLLPAHFFQERGYDFCVRLLVEFPGGDRWLTAGELDRFFAPGIINKLAISSSLLLPNLAILGAIGLLVGWVRYRRGVRCDALAVITVLGLLGAGVHVWHALPVVVQTVLAPWQGTTSEALAGREEIGALAILGGAWVLARTTARSRLATTVAITSAVGIALSFWIVSPPNGASAAAVAMPTANLPRVENVVLISIDSLRADRLGCYGHKRDTSPNMDRLAAEGVLFTNAWATSSWTLTSHMSLLTGRDALAHAVISEGDRLPRAILTLADALRAEGMATWGIVSEGDLLGSWYGFGRGFDGYDDTTAVAQMGAMHEETAPVVTQLAIDRLKEVGGRPTFLFLHYWDVHYDYVPPPPYDTLFDPHYTGSITGENFVDNPAINTSLPKRDLEHVMALYDGEIRWVDEHIGKLMKALDEIGIADSTAVIIVSDHGDEFLEHGGTGHGRQMYREVAQIPLIVRVPGALRGHVVQNAVSLTDVMPTILDLRRQEIPPGVDGVSLVAALTGGDVASRPAVYGVRCMRGVPGCRIMQHSPIGTLLMSFWPYREQFFRPDDLAQKDDVAYGGDWPRSDQLSLLGHQLETQWASSRRAKRRPLRTPSEATQQRLRQLGYTR